jgi:CubicO group peptidase (beta-lactamase class C family)
MVRLLKGRIPTGLVLALFCLVFALPVRALPQEGYARTVEAAREGLWRAVTDDGAVAAAVAVMDGGRIVYSEGFGVADRASQAPVGPESPFNIGSTSKIFAALSVMLLADEGAVDLDGPVVTYLPEFVMADGRHRDITVRMLVNHASGLPGSTFLFSYDDIGDAQQLLLETMREARLKHDPGAHSIYCNDGFTLAERLVETVSGRPFLTFIAERIFEPLGMTCTGPSVGERGAGVRVYEKTGRAYPLEWIAVYGAGGLSSTADDLCRFGDSFTAGGPSLLSEAARAEMLRPQPTAFVEKQQGPALLNAFGWDYAELPRFRERGIQVLAKTGGTGCYTTDLIVLPEERLVLAVTVAGRVDIEALARPIVLALLADKGLPLPVEEPLVKAGAAEPLPEGIEEWAGFYVDGGDLYRLSFDGKKRTAEIVPLGRNEARPLSLSHRGGRFYAEEGGRSTSHYFVADGEERYLLAGPVPLYGVDVIRFQKIEPLERPQTLEAAMDGRIWLIRNLPPRAQAFADVLLSESYLYPELPGYVNCWGLHRVTGERETVIVSTAFRDQVEIRLLDEGCLQAGPFLFGPAESAPVLKEGRQSLTVGDDGQNQWLRIADEAILSFDVPGEARAIVVVPDSPFLFDSLVDDGEILAPTGSYLFFAGPPRSVLEISAR